MVNMDKLIPQLGGFGFYQKRLLFLLSLPIASTAMFMIMMVFALYTPSHRCKLPYSINGTSNITLKNLYTARQCEIDVSTLNESTPHADNSSYRMTSFSCNQWDYSEDVFVETFTTTHNLVCDDAFKTSHAQMIFYFGVVIGDVCFGQMADYVGRKKAFISTVLLLFISGLSASWAPEYYSFIIMQFIVGAACKGCLVLSFVFGLEFVGPAVRVGVGVPFNIYFAIGLCALCGVGYLIRDWHYIQIASSIPVILFLPYWCILDESPRWLISKGRTDEARKILDKIARVNKVIPDEDLLDNIENEDEKNTGKIWHLFTKKVLALRTIVVFFNWFAIGMTYYGVFLHAENLGGNFYLAIFLLSVIELPILLVSLYLLNRFGRRKVHCIWMLTGGLACICTIFPVMFGGEELQPLILTLAVIGKMGASGAFGSIYVISGEVFPTVIRTGAVGVSSSCARIASMVAPYIAKMSMLAGAGFGKALPLIIFGVCSIIAGLCSLFLPETKGYRLPDTIEDAVDFEWLREDLGNFQLQESEVLNKKSKRISQQ